MKKGLALIYDPHNLYQFIWYYCTYERDCKWDALCLPNGYKGEYMSEYCEKSGIFENIIRDSKDFMNMPFGKKIIFGLKMLTYALCGKQNVFCRKLLNNYVNIDEYDTIVVLTDSGMVSGACMTFGKEKHVAVLEDGISDYFDRPKHYLLKHLTDQQAWKGFILSKMGYLCPGHRFRLKSSSYCDKFCSNPDLMKYLEYKTINQLFDFTKTDREEYNRINRCIYNELEEIDFEDVDAVIFTSNIEDNTKNPQKYMRRFEEYINDNYSNVIIKKHPRDVYEYSFDSKLRVQEINNSIPAEVVLPYISKSKVIFMYTSTILLYINPYGIEPVLTYFDGLEEDSKKSNVFMKYDSKESLLNTFYSYGVKRVECVQV